MAARQAVAGVEARTGQPAATVADAAARGAPSVGAAPPTTTSVVVAATIEAARRAGPRGPPDAASELSARRVQAQTSDVETEQLRVEGVRAAVVADAAAS